MSLTHQKQSIIYLYLLIRAFTISTTFKTSLSLVVCPFTSLSCPFCVLIAATTRTKCLSFYLSISSALFQYSGQRHTYTITPSLARLTSPFHSTNTHFRHPLSCRVYSNHMPKYFEKALNHWPASASICGACIFSGSNQKGDTSRIRHKLRPENNNNISVNNNNFLGFIFEIEVCSSTPKKNQKTPRVLNVSLSFGVRQTCLDIVNVIKRYQKITLHSIVE